MKFIIEIFQEKIIFSTEINSEYVQVNNLWRITSNIFLKWMNCLYYYTANSSGILTIWIDIFKQFSYDFIIWKIIQQVDLKEIARFNSNFTLSWLNFKFQSKKYVKLSGCIHNEKLKIMTLSIPLDVSTRQKSLEYRNWPYTNFYFERTSIFKTNMFLQMF